LIPNRNKKFKKSRRGIWARISISYKYFKKNDYLCLKSCREDCIVSVYTPEWKWSKIPSHAWPGIYIHELIYMFKWRSHSPGSMKNMSNKRASALNKVLRGNLPFIIFC